MHMQVERYFALTGVLSSNYWLGMYWDSAANKWTWKDDSSIGNGAVSNSNPCAHQAR